MKNDHLQQEPLKNVNLGMNEKLGVDPPPSPTTPTSYRQLFCNLRQVHPYGETTSLLRTHAYCKTHAYYDMSYHNVKLVSYYKITVYKRWVWWGTVAFSIPDFSLIPRLTFFNGHLDGNFFLSIQQGCPSVLYITLQLVEVFIFQI